MTHLTLEDIECYKKYEIDKQNYYTKNKQAFLLLGEDEEKESIDFNLATDYSYSGEERLQNRYCIYNKL